MMSSNVPSPIDEGYNHPHQRRGGKVPQRLGKALKWSESHGYRWLRIALCIVLIVILPKGFTEMGSFLNQVGQVKEQPYTVTLDFDNAVAQGHYTLLSRDDMQICFYIRPPAHLISPPRPTNATANTTLANATTPGGEMASQESTPSPI